MNRSIYGKDCLEVLRDEIALPSGSVDLIYLDPPFNSKSNYNLPFKGKLKKDLKPVEAFVDIWRWGEQEEEYFNELSNGPRTKVIADIIKITQSINNRGGSSLSAYLINMAIRLIPMKRVLKDTGSIYLHCDPTASHYLKLVMDAIFGHNNFLNEVIWHYGKWTNAGNAFQKNHDVLLIYAIHKGHHKFTKLVDEAAREHYKKGWHTNVLKDGTRQLIVYDKVKATQYIKSDKYDRIVDRTHQTKVVLPDVWNIPIINPMAKERMGYPTQKPLQLLQRIIKASSQEGDTILDPFGGCGTTIHAAEHLNRNWIGIDISTFSAGLMKERILSNFPTLNSDDIDIYGTPYDRTTARKLAKTNPFEFEKWVCGEIGAHGMFHNPGERGADAGVDGVLNFATFEAMGNAHTEYAIVQVKGGKVTANAVKALSHTIDQFGAKAGILVCFEESMKTVENNRKKDTYSDLTGSYPVIQGFSVESLLKNERPKLPPLVFRKDARLQEDIFQQKEG